MDKIWNQIERLVNESNGMITTAQVEADGISRTALKKYVDEGQLVRVRKGLYTVENYLADEYALLQARSGKALFPMVPLSFCGVCLIGYLTPLM